MLKKRGKHLLKFIIAVCGSLAILLPLYFIFINSLKTVEESRQLTFSLPRVFQWENYIEVVKAGSLIRAFANSLLIAGTSCALCVLVSAMAAFVLSRRKTRLHRFLYLLFFGGLIAPVNYIMTLFTMKTLHIQNTYFGMIL